MLLITIALEADILPLADALAAGGFLRVLEVALRSEHGLEAIGRVSSNPVPRRCSCSPESVQSRCMLSNFKRPATVKLQKREHRQKTGFQRSL
jgi:hypothetical protein